MSELDDYRLEVLIALRRLERLDKDAVTEDERADAEEVCAVHVCVYSMCVYSMCVYGTCGAEMSTVCVCAIRV